MVTVIATGIGVILAATGTSVDAAALLFAASGLFVVSALTFATGPKRRVAKRDIEYESKTIVVGHDLPDSGWEKDKSGHTLLLARDYAEQHGLYFHALVLGKDGRWSTSKVQLLAWTYAVVFGLASLFIAKWLGDDAGWTAQVDHGLQDAYLILLGGPFAAAVLSKAVTSKKVEDGTIQKTEATPSTDPIQGFGEVVSDDSGNTDLVDLQYFLFNLLALIFFLGTFIFNLDDGFPEVPDLLVGLTSLSAAGYVGKKAADRAIPALTALLPPEEFRGKEIDIWGQNLLIQAVAGDPKLPSVLIANKKADDVRVVHDGLTGSDHLRVTVPGDADPGPTHLVLVTAAGVAPENPLDFTVLPD